MLLGAGEDPFARLEDLPEARGDAEVGGGWFGWLGYGLGARVERLPPRPPRPVPLPDAHLAFYDHVLRQDAAGIWWFESLGDDAPLERLRALLDAPLPPAPPVPAEFSLRAPGAGGHVAAVRDCVERIAAGEIFQANLCLRLEAAWHGSVADLFATAAPQLRPGYGACFVTPWGGIASLSPELFLRRRGRVVTTGPIKGTAPRNGAPSALQDSAKDRAEHVMIVDLMRNDLGRVAEYGSVEAPVAPELQPHSGRLASGLRGPRAARAGQRRRRAAARDVPARLGHRRAEGAGAARHLRAGGDRPRGLHGRDRLREPARRARAERRDPHVRGPRRAGCGSAPAAGSWPTPTPRRSSRSAWSRRAR